MNEIQSRKYTDKCGEISGFGGTYEEACRKMVISGLEWLDNHENADPQHGEWKGVFGLIVNQNEDSEALTDHMVNAINGDATGAMVQACLSHIRYVQDNGWEKYIQMMEDRKDESK